MGQETPKKRKWESARLQYGSRRHRSNQSDHSQRAKKRDLGRTAWSRQQNDRRADIQQRAAKRQRTSNDDRSAGTEVQVSGASPEAAQKRHQSAADDTQQHSGDENIKEERRPKRKVAVMIGYAGSGYRGMQINNEEKTIEGDLFAAFVAAGAISRANANDPKKSQLVRCARTDKGVHAAGNVISLKLIIEDPDVVAKINAHLDPQIRVWGFQRTINSFSAYQACDSRWYEYLIPTHSFLPPHPSTWFAKRLQELADEFDDGHGYRERQEEVSEFWAKTDDAYITPIVYSLEENIRDKVLEALYRSDGTEENVVLADQTDGLQKSDDVSADDAARMSPGATEKNDAQDTAAVQKDGTTEEARRARIAERRALDSAAKDLRNAYMSAKRAWRIPPSRLARIQPILDRFIGTQNFHNYTVQKTFQDPSANRHIRSFYVNPDPIVINGTEWLSIKIHGQSFMMHQIRKMIGAVALIIRYGCNPSRITETLGSRDFSIPKVPGLGLLLERPVFDSYNAGAAKKFEREQISFTPYEKEMDDFKQREIYERIYREEEAGNAFHAFFTHVDHFTEPDFLWLSSGGFEAVQNAKDQMEDPARVNNRAAVQSSDEEDVDAS